jgi:2-polyprenyl-3-methyl-5-hydroxy-6-metoxy-1,4-benzoquinol methylase
LNPLSDAKILESWHKNAVPWTAAVRSGEIVSRKLATDRAIVDAVLSLSPRSVLDLGCGEGWLARALAANAIHVTGIDVVPALIERAQAAGGGRFLVGSYEDIVGERLGIRADVVVCNFSLLGDDSVKGVFKAVPSMLNSGGSFVVQTVHPVVASGSLPYQDGWREGSWDGFGPDFIDPAPWYFRTLESWIGLLAQNGFRLREMREPIHPATLRPASVIFVADADVHEPEPRDRK